MTNTARQLFTHRVEIFGVTNSAHDTGVVSEGERDLHVGS